MSAKRLQVSWNPPERCSASVFLSERGCAFTCPSSLNAFTPRTDVAILTTSGVGMEQLVESITVFLTLVSFLILVFNSSS